jgi:hypothetical protein
MELLQAGHINDNLGLRRVTFGVVLFSCLDDEIDDIREAAATAATLGHGMIDLGRDDQLPTVIVEQLDDRVPDVRIGDVIAAADEHFGRPDNMTINILFLLKKRLIVKK